MDRKIAELKHAELLQLLMHGGQCVAGDCVYGHTCTKAKILLTHVSYQHPSPCMFPFCEITKDIICHWANCKSRETCQVCVYVDSDKKRAATYSKIMCILS